MKKMQGQEPHQINKENSCTLSRYFHFKFYNDWSLPLTNYDLLTERDNTTLDSSKINEGYVEIPLQKSQV
jgi:hypothetical protein